VFDEELKMERIKKQKGGDEDIYMPVQHSNNANSSYRTVDFVDAENPDEREILQYLHNQYKKTKQKTKMNLSIEDDDEANIDSVAEYETEKASGFPID